MYARKSRQMIGIALAASLLLSSSTLTVAQQTSSTERSATSTNDWSRLNTISPDSKLIVKLKNGKTVSGKLKNVSDTGLSLAVKDKPVEVRRDDVSSVYQITKPSGTKATLIGLGVGAGAGLGIGLAATARDNGNFSKIDQGVTAGLTILGAGVGAFAGYLIGKGGGKRVLIYEAK